LDNKRLKDLLKSAELSKKALAEKTNLAYSTVNNWGSSQNIPHWVESWLENYIKARYFERIVEAIETIKKDIPD
jgi:transcriptional regulator with XRE-family HTH domain